jgi:hypothetical protein
MAPKPITPQMHGVLDYTTGATLQVMPALLGIEGSRAGKILHAAGAIHAGYSVFTRYPMGVVKVLPYRAHLALDTVWACGLAASPFATGAALRGVRHWMPHVFLGAYELLTLALTDKREPLEPTKATVARAAQGRPPAYSAPTAFPSGHPRADGTERADRIKRAGETADRGAGVREETAVNVRIGTQTGGRSPGTGM